MVYVIVELPAATPVTNPVFDTVATERLVDTQGLSEAAVAEPDSCVVDSTHTVNVPDIVGNGFIVTVKDVPVLLQPVVVFFTVMVPVYVAAAAAAGTVRVIFEAGKAVRATWLKPAVIAASLQVILY